VGSLHHQVFTVASIVSVAPVQPYLFRNYQYPEPPPGYNPGGYHFRRMGSCKHGLWQSVRASSAAPYYLEDYAHENERCEPQSNPYRHPNLSAGRRTCLSQLPGGSA
jgi:hypothetical protein